jgi:uncharacterized protein Yka (UPF0111/DUF47 family)
MFEAVGRLLSRAAAEFLALVTEFDKLPERCAALKKLESDCDDVVAGIFQALDLSFITPFDREDIHALAKALDDVMDNMEEGAHRFMIFRIEKAPAPVVALAKNILDCCGRLEEIVRLIRTMKDVEKLHHNLREISRLENEADHTYREAESNLFADPPDILVLIKLRELYGWLEETVDSCQAAADVLSEIVIKGT